MKSFVPIGAAVEIMVSDPWDFGTLHGCGPFLATVNKVGKEFWTKNSVGAAALLLQLKTPVAYRESHCEFLIASAREEGRERPG
jgi:hypothetical protein